MCTITPFQIYFKLKVERVFNKSPLISGDPCVYGNLQPPAEVQDAVVEVVKNAKHNGYAPSTGFDAAREAVAEYISVNNDTKIAPRDVILCSGCSSALEMCITVLADGSKNQNILIPRPGFPIYRTLAECINVEVRMYNLLPERNWEVDLAHLESLIDHNTAAVVINNPSNPCGSVYAAEHLQNILGIAYEYRIPVIADEIYEHIVFRGHIFTSFSKINTSVPILICSGLAKRFLVPGWRLGWIYIHDPIQAFESEVRCGLNALAQRTIGSNTLVQGALPAILQETPQVFYDGLVDTLQRHAELLYDSLSRIKGLMPHMPAGTMYMMVQVKLELFPEFQGSGLKFVTQLMEEESVFCLPGEVNHSFLFFKLYLHLLLHSHRYSLYDVIRHYR